MSLAPKFPKKPPPRLAVANIHPDYLDTCFELCSTGTRNNCRLPPGTIIFVRRTAGGSTAKSYGVVGVWFFTGTNEQVPRRRYYWPSRWDNRVVCREVSSRFKETWCEDFSVKLSERYMAPKGSVHVPGLLSTKLQGTIVSIKDPEIAAAYVDAIVKARKDELSSDLDYGGRVVKGTTLLRELQSSLGKK